MDKEKKTKVRTENKGNERKHDGKIQRKNEKRAKIN